MLRQGNEWIEGVVLTSSPWLQQGDSYYVQFYDLDHLGGFLLLTAIAVHFTGELGMSCP